MKERIEVSAPGKLMLFGEHAVVYDRPCLVTAVDYRMRVSVEPQSKNMIQIDAPEVGVRGYSRSIDSLGRAIDMPKGVRFVETSVKNFYEEFGVASGLKVETKSEFSSEFGFGSSSAVTVGVLKSLSELFGKKMTNEELFELSYKSVLEVQGVGSGFDLAAAIWGGTLYFVTGGKEIQPLKTGNLPLVAGYTGIKADTPKLVRQVAALRERQHNTVDALFDIITVVVQDAREAVVQSDYKQLGELMNINQGLLDALGVGSKELSKLIFAAREGGAYGAKLSGAGGGDCMIAFVSDQKRQSVEKTIEDRGGKVIHVKTGTQGVRVE